MHRVGVDVHPAGHKRPLALVILSIFLALIYWFRHFNTSNGLTLRKSINRCIPRLYYDLVPKAAPFL